MKVYDPIEKARRQLELAELIPDPATDPVFMAAARAAVIAGGNVPWDDLPEEDRVDPPTKDPTMDKPAK